jgi:hypothetical protein
MRSQYRPAVDQPGYSDCVLESNDDYEPYGYASLELQPVHDLNARRNTAFDRVIEAQLLADSSMVGC